MWAVTVGIDNGYSKERERILQAVEKRRWLTSATVIGEHRAFIQLAVEDGRRAQLENFLEELFCKLFLSYTKFGYLSPRLNFEVTDYATAALTSALLCFDADVERAAVLKAMRECGDYNYDGLFNFRLKQLKANWEELAELACNLMAAAEDEEDVFYATNFILSAPENEKSRLLIYKINNEIIIKNLMTGARVEVEELFGVQEYDVLRAVLSERTAKVTAEGELPYELLAALKHFCGLKKGIY